jgi:YVTN family beta-propeller protein
MSDMNLNIRAERDVTIGEFVGRDKIVNNIQNIIQRALTAAEEAAQEQSLETQKLAQGVSAFVQRLQAAARDIQDIEVGRPYKGLLEYRLNDAQIFFGRSQAIRNLLQHIAQGRLTVLHAESGAGKTSLVQAGILPRLISAGHLPVYLRPYDLEPSLAVKRAFISDPSLTPILSSSPMRDFLRQVCDVLGPQIRLYIFLDQFEEFFTQLKPQGRAEFARELAECLDDEGLNVRWILSMRAEFFGNLTGLRPFVQNPFQNEYRLNHLTRDEAREVITAPAERHKLNFEEGLVDSLLSDLATGADVLPPPQIQLVCSALYEGLKSGEHTLTRALYNANGGAAGILRSHLERVLKRGLPSEQRAIAQRALEALITADARRLLRTRDDLLAELNAGQPKPISAEALGAVLEHLVQNNLLHTREAPGGGEAAFEAASGLAYELAHDFLLEQIKVDPAVQARKAAQEMLDQEVRAYQRYGTFLNADKLAVLKAQQENLSLTDSARELVQKSEQRLRQQQRLFAGSLGAAVVGVLVALLAFGLALNAGRQQSIAVGTQRAAQTEAAAAAVQKAEAQDAAQAAQAQQATSVAQAVAAATREIEARKGETLAQERELAAKAVVRDLFQSEGLVPVGQRPAAFAFDGQRLWVANKLDNTVQAIDPATGEATTPITVGAQPCALEFDGARVWVAYCATSSLQPLDPAAGTLGQPIAVGNVPAALEFDGERLWVANRKDDTVQAIDPTTGVADAPIPVGAAPSALAFDGARVWVANSEEDTVQAINPESGEVSVPLQVGPGPTALLYAANRLWVTNFLQGEVQTIDPTSNRVNLAFPVGDTPFALTFDGYQVWVANRGGGTVQAIDPDLSSVGTPIRVGSATALAFVGGRLWIASQDSRTVRGLDPLAGSLHSPVAVGEAPSAMTFDGSQLWVANSGSNNVQPLDPNALPAEASAVQRVDDLVQSGSASLSDLDELYEEPTTAASGEAEATPAPSGGESQPPPAGETPQPTPTGEIPQPTPSPGVDDADNDGVPDDLDNCPFFANPGQEDSDGDGVGDVCDQDQPADSDDDGIPDDFDNCPFTFNPGQEDSDGNGIGDACDQAPPPDSDGDGVPDDLDNCPFTFNPGQEDSDGNGIGDACDQAPPPDSDGDGVPDDVDNCPFTFNPGQEDSNGNGVGDACETPLSPPSLSLTNTRHVAHRPASFKRPLIQLAAARSQFLISHLAQPDAQEAEVVPVGNYPFALEFDGTHIWVANLDDGNVQAIDPATGQAQPPIPVGAEPIALVFDNSRLWVANFGDDTVQALDPQSEEASAPIAVDAGPGALVFDGQRVWVANAQANTIQPIDVTTGQAGDPIRVGTAPFALAFDGVRVWVANYRDDTVQALDLATRKLGKPIPVGNGPAALAVGGGRVWVANYLSNTLQTIDPETGRVSAPIVVDLGPYALLFDGQRLWIANQHSNTIQYLVVIRDVLAHAPETEAR